MVLPVISPEPLVAPGGDGQITRGRPDMVTLSHGILCSGSGCSLRSPVRHCCGRWLELAVEVGVSVDGSSSGVGKPFLS